MNSHTHKSPILGYLGMLSNIISRVEEKKLVGKLSTNKGGLSWY